jgi:hypothetical protein
MPIGGTLAIAPKMQFAMAISLILFYLEIGVSSSELTDNGADFFDENEHALSLVYLSITAVLLASTV